ncbi:MAG: hypothetical protein KJZ80_16155 [Hyphomicrobiaceae bacterium]|nr:hypothetical protein [Hyphomicrobiaceae bacterium]
MVFGDEFNRKFDTNKTDSVEGEARRGAHNARAWLAEGLSQVDIWRFVEWSLYDEELGGDHPARAAYHRAFREVLRPHLINEEAAAREARRADAEALARLSAEEE